VFKILLYVTAILSSLACTVLLFRGYRRRHIRLMMWSAICFAGLTVNNVALFVDLVILPDLNLRLLRLVPALAGMLSLLYGFISDGE
jgi:uncharacterized protein DUF5985